ncbi:MAG: NADH-dependent [FeFe] hydrogenase, group A6 [Bacteroidales bacterium]|jgi:NADH-quinone oxidoreductase subunit G/[NiFe] hydrogenase diaphorase moiety small subunit/NADP-reducing hydrogenase subunit HndD|nr:NADH-dependent [FeFe] hydrogenase, group A6 [Bacteroidales bacterium]
MNNKINLTIDGIKVAVDEGQSILDAAKKVNVKIPTLCHHEDLCVAGNCRVCVVEVEGMRNLQASCAYPAQDGMVVRTNSAMVRRSRRDIISLLVSEHSTQCTTCYRSTNCELQTLAAEYNVDNDMFLSVLKDDLEVDKSSWSIEKDDKKCIRCQRCVRTCAELQGVNAISVAHKGKDMKISTFLDLPLNEVVCVNCGQCVNRCPTGALTERRYYNEIWDAIGDPEKHVVMNTAPSVRVGLGEMLGYPVGTRVTGKMVTAMKKMGIDSVLDTDFSADLTIVEEGNELLSRLKKVVKEGDTTVDLPMITSCSPGWVKFIEHMYPDHLGHLSTCKSPQQMFGALAKTYYADKTGVNPENIVSVAIMPCAAKKYEANRAEMNSSNYRDVDAGLTTRELGHMIKQAGLNFLDLDESKYDSIMGESTGAGVIFGATGGVMEAALRTAYEVITGRDVPFENLNITAVRGEEGIKEASIRINGCLPEWDFLEGVELRVAVAHGLINARKIMDQIAKGESPYHFIEIMACPGGCIGGGGQPIPTNAEIRRKRTKAIYDEDMGMPLRKSHENPEIITLYNDYLKEPLGHKSHELLHTHYRKRNRY